VQAQTALADQLGVRGTPTFFIVGWGTIPGALPLETFQQVIDTVLVEAAAGQL
jgi:protein-disulfide isomerase